MKHWQLLIKVYALLHDSEIDDASLDVWPDVTKMHEQIEEYFREQGMRIDHSGGHLGYGLFPIKEQDERHTHVS